MSQMFSLNYKDWAKGLALAVIVVIVGGIQQALTAHGLDVASYDWAGIGKVAVETTIAYLLKNFLSKDGKVMGKIG